MFDSVLMRRETLPRRRFAAGTVIAIALHAGVVSLVLYASAVVPERKKVDVAVTFVRPPPPPPPAPRVAPHQARPRPRPREPRTVLPQAIVAPTVVPQEKPPEQEPTPEQEVSEGVEGGEVGGVPGGIVGGVVDSQARLEFDTRMTPPVYLSGPDPKYTARALEQEIEGLMIVKCVVTTDGRVYDCRVVKSLPYMDRAVIDALERRRYRPATLGGNPVEVDYTFRIRLVLPP